MIISNNFGLVNPTNNALNKAQQTKEDKKMLEACKQFETIFINQLFSEMRSTVPKDGMFEESTGENIFKGMLDEEYSKQMADAGGIGLAQMIYQQLKQKTAPTK